MTTLALQAPTPPIGTLEQRAAWRGADLVFEGGGVKGIGLVGAVRVLADAGFTFPRVGGTSAGAIVAALVAAYQTAGVSLTQLETDMRELDYRRFKACSALQRYTGPVGRAVALAVHDGIYETSYLTEWLSAKLDACGVRTFADLKITDDPDISLPVHKRYRLVVHTTDLTRKCLVRLPWDLPQYLVPTAADETEQLAAIDAYPVVAAVRASMSIPFFFRPVRQQTARGACTWVDGGVLQNFPITVFDRTDAQPPRWPTFGIKLSGRPGAGHDRPVRTPLGEVLAIAHTALGQWNGYALADGGYDDRTVWVDTMHVEATDFDLSRETSEQLYENGRAAAAAFLAAEVVRPRTPLSVSPSGQL